MSKVGLEALAHRVQDDDALLCELVDNPSSEPLREHVRYGRLPEWPISIRRLYAESTRWSDATDDEYQILHEFEFLYTDEGELYFILALFGTEVVINLGGPVLDGWTRWLIRNNGMSSLYVGNNMGTATLL